MDSVAEPCFLHNIFSLLGEGYLVWSALVFMLDLCMLQPSATLAPFSCLRWLSRVYMIVLRRHQGIGTAV